MSDTPETPVTEEPQAAPEAAPEAQAAPDAPAAEAPAAEGKPWYADLPESVHELAKRYDSLDAFAQAAVHARKALGDKDDDSKWVRLDGDRRDVLRKLGLPEKPEDYKLEFEERDAVPDAFKNVDELPLGKVFKETAFEAGVLPEQAKAMWVRLSRAVAEDAARAEAAAKQRLEEGHAALKEAWGEAYADRLADAKRAVQALDAYVPGVADALEKTGALADPVVVKALAEVVASHLIRKDLSDLGPQFAGQTATPDGIREQIVELQRQIAKTFDPTEQRELSRKVSALMRKL